MMFPPRIEVLYIEDCPQWQAALELARSAARMAGAAEVDVFAIEVRSRQEALRFGFAGSPTILVEGRDPFLGVPTGRPGPPEGVPRGKVAGSIVSGGRGRPRARGDGSPKAAAAAPTEPVKASRVPPTM